MKTNLHFSLSRSGVLSFDRAETVVEFSEWVDVPVKNQATNETKPTLKKPDLSSDTEGNGPEDSTTKVEDGATLEASNTTDAKDSSISETPVQEVIMEKKLRKRTVRVPLKVSYVCC